MNKPSWIDAMKEEIYEFKRLQVWKLMPCPDKVILIKLKWNCKVKTDEFGGAICFFVGNAANKNMTIFQMDVKTEFLNGKLKEERKIQFPDREPQYEKHVSGNAKTCDRARGRVKLVARGTSVANWETISSLSVWIKSLLDAVEITAAQVYVNTALIKFLLKDMDQDSAHMVVASKVPMLKPGEYEIWRIRIEQYIQMIDYALWEVIKNGTTLPITKFIEGVMTEMPITTAEEKAQRRLEVKARSALMMGIPNKHQLKFNSIKYAKKLLEAVEKRFGGNADTKKTQRNLLKHTNKAVNTAHGVSTASTHVNAAYSTNIDNLSDAVICSFFASQQNSPQLIHEDLEQIYPDDMEEMDLRWQIAMVTLRARSHKRGHLARECRALRNQDNKNKESSRRSVPMETSTSIALVSCDGLGRYDWSDQEEEEPNYALMAFASLSSDSEVSNYSSCLKSCLETVKLLKSQNDQLLKDLKESELMVLGEIVIRELRKKLEIAQKEKDGIQLNVDKFKHASKSLNKLIECQIVDNCKKGLGYENYNAVPPSYIGNFMPLTHDLCFTSLDEFVNKLVVENYKAMSGEEEHKVVRKKDDALIIEESMSGNEEEDVSQPKIEKKIVRPSIAKIEFVKSKKQKKTVRKTVKKLSNIGKTLAGNPQMDLQDQGVIDSGCSRHITGNMSYFTDYKEIDGGYVSFGGNPNEGKSQEKAMSLNFKIMNKLVKGNLVRGLPSKLFENDQICVACQKGKQHRASYHLGKFNDKADEGFFVGYSLNSKAFRVFISRTRIVEENLHIRFSESIPNVVGQARKETELVKVYILLSLWTVNPPFSQDLKSSHDDGSKPSSDDGKEVDEDPRKENKCKDQEKEDNVNSTNNFRDVSIFNFSSDDEDDGTVANMNNLNTTIQVSPILTIRIHKDHPLDHVIGDLQLATQTRKISKNLEEHGFVSTTQQRTNHKDLQNFLFACFLSHEEPKKVIHALKDPSWIEAMQEELLQFKLQEVWTLVGLLNGKRAIGTKWVFRNKNDEKGIMIRNKARLVAQGYTQEEGIGHDEVFASVARIEAIRLFLAYASFKIFMVYQMDVKSDFLYGKIKKEVYVCQPQGFEDSDIPNRVYKVKKALYALHQASRAWLMHEKFKMSSMAELTFFLGLQVKQKKDGTFVSQDKYVTKILKKIRFIEVKTASTALETQKTLLKDKDGEEVDVQIYQVNPKVSHLHAMKRIFRVMWRLFVVVGGRDILRDQRKRCGHFKDEEMDCGACR
nr:hypothetical protein [Tanacetum cinerariifolium]